VNRAFALQMNLARYAAPRFRRGVFRRWVRRKFLLSGASAGREFVVCHQVAALERRFAARLDLEGSLLPAERDPAAFQYAMRSGRSRNVL